MEIPASAFLPDEYHEWCWERCVTYECYRKCIESYGVGKEDE